MKKQTFSEKEMQLLRRILEYYEDSSCILVSDVLQAVLESNEELKDFKREMERKIIGVRQYNE